MATSLIQSHLRKYAEDGIQQKVRLSNLVTRYNNQEIKTRERIIDQTALLNSMRTINLSSDKLTVIQKRLDEDNKVLVNVQSHLEESVSETEKLAIDLSTHMEELTALEISAGGFVTHPIGVDSGAQLDKEQMIVELKPNGHVEIPIGTRMNSWKDSSQLTINKIKKAGN